MIITQDVDNVLERLRKYLMQQLNNSSLLMQRSMYLLNHLLAHFKTGLFVSKQHEAHQNSHLLRIRASAHKHLSESHILIYVNFSEGVDAVSSKKIAVYFLPNSPV